MAGDAKERARPLPGWTHERSPYHAGEQAIQERVGVRDSSERAGRRVIRDFMSDQHRQFFAAQPLLLIGSLDRRSRLWASILVGQPGFISSPDPRTLRVNALPGLGDALGANLASGAPVGLLGIEFQTRRRNRMNGTLVRLDNAGFDVRVDQSFGNCPQYIQARKPWFIANPSGAVAPRPVRAEGAILSAGAAAVAARADTFFIATAAPAARMGDSTEGVDVSHRGGKPGFVRVTEEGGHTLLTAPDFVGNFAFNTFGNLALNPRAGFLFVDFVSGDVLSLTGAAEVIWDGPEVAAFAGAERLLKFRVDEGVWIENAIPLRWTAPEPAAQLAATGSWEEAERAIAAARRRNDYRPLRVTRVENESDTVRSFYLEPADGGGLASYQPGQFLPLALDVPGHANPVRRTYTLSDEPNGRHYRISVKREVAPGRLPGVASNWLHDTIQPGATLHAMAPRGDFVLDPASHRPVVLLSGGVGLTPMIAILNHLTGGTAERMRYPGRRVWFIHAARHGGEHAFGAHVRALAESRPTLTVHVRYEAPRSEDVLGRDYDSAGRVDATLLKHLLPLDDYDFYLCGPAGFMQATYELILDLGAREERIRWEAFGPVQLEQRGRAAAAVERPRLTPARAAQIEFRASGTTADWDPSKGTLLDLAEAAGIAAPWSCRSGTCGTCTTRLLAGTVTYAEPPTAQHDDDQALICSALPASDRVAIDL